MKKWENFSEEELSEIVKNSSSLAQVSKKIGYNGGSGTAAVKEMLSHYNFDTSHFKGQGWNKNNFDYSRFKKGNAIKIANALPALTAKRGHHCEKCNLKEWQNQKIPLEIHHIDGDPINNEENNLLLLCPNCHALTENYRGKNINKKQEHIIPEEKYVAALKESSSIRQALLSLGLSAKGGNYTRARELICKYNISHLL